MTDRQRLWGLTGVVATAAMLHALAMAWPGTGQAHGWLQWLALLSLAWVLCQQATPRQAALWGAVFGTTSLAAATWWLYISLSVYGNVPAGLAVLSVLLLSVALSAYLAFACWFYVTCQSAMSSWWARSMLFAACFGFSELARGVFFTGFPWASAGYAHVDSGLAALAPWLGVYGMGMVSAGLALAVAQGLPDKRALTAVALVVAWMAWPYVPGETGQHAEALPALRVALLQGNVPQDRKFSSARASALQWYAAELTRSDADLVVTPETAIPMAVQHLPEGYWGQLTGHFAARQQSALVGLPWLDTGQYRNSAVGLHAGAVYRYDKAHLVPFGEFVPPLFRWFTQMMGVPLGDFGRGAQDPPPFEVAGQRVAPNICFEDLFGEELATRFRDPARAPTVMVNMSNLAWFGNTVALDQHLSISRLRTLELARPMIRATNTGATAIIDHRGRVTYRLPPETRGVLVGDVVGQTGASTFFAGWAGRWGLAPLWLFCGGLMALAIGMRLRKKAKAPC